MLVHRGADVASTLPTKPTLHSVLRTPVYVKLGYAIRRVYFPREHNILDNTSDGMSARPLAASVASLALGYDERSTWANIQHVENPHWGGQVLVTPGYSDAPDGTSAASEQQGIDQCAEVASKIGIFSVATRSNQRAQTGVPQCNCSGRAA